MAKIKPMKFVNINLSGIQQYRDLNEAVITGMSYRRFSLLSQIALRNKVNRIRPDGNAPFDMAIHRQSGKYFMLSPTTGVPLNMEVLAEDLAYLGQQDQDLVTYTYLSKEYFSATLTPKGWRLIEQGQNVGHSAFMGISSLSRGIYCGIYLLKELGREEILKRMTVRDILNSYEDPFTEEEVSVALRELNFVNIIELRYPDERGSTVPLLQDTMALSRGIFIRASPKNPVVGCIKTTIRQSRSVLSDTKREDRTSLPPVWL